MSMIPADKPMVKDRTVLRLGTKPTDRKVVITRDEMTAGRRDRLYKTVTRLKYESNLDTRYPRIKVKEKDPQSGEETEREENVEEWSLRVAPAIAEQYARKEGQTEEEFIDMIHEENMKSDLVTISFEIISDTMESFAKGTLTKEEYEKAPYGDIEDFVLDLLTFGKVAFNGRFWPVEK